MAQLSLRLDDDLHRRARLAADAAGTSLNAFIARVLRVATDPASTEPEADRIRARLYEAGLIDSPHFAGRSRTSAEEVELAELKASIPRGTSASELIAQERAEGW